jgi:hypothetical protein
MGVHLARVAAEARPLAPQQGSSTASGSHPLWCCFASGLIGRSQVLQWVVGSNPLRNLTSVDRQARPLAAHPSIKRVGGTNQAIASDPEHQVLLAGSKLRITCAP